MENDVSVSENGQSVRQTVRLLDGNMNPTGVIVSVEVADAARQAMLGVIMADNNSSELPPLPRGFARRDGRGSEQVANGGVQSIIRQFENAPLPVREEPNGYRRVARLGGPMERKNSYEGLNRMFEGGEVLQTAARFTDMVDGNRGNKR